MALKLLAFVVAVLFVAAATAVYHRGEPAMPTNLPAPEPVAKPTDPGTETATFGGGCFWCTEAVYQQLKGVQLVVSGYSGGTTADPSYDDICTGRTGHAEVIQITFDPAVIAYAELLEVFWKTHDPTTLNQQGADHGTQYRSVVFYHNDTQKHAAETYKKRIDDSGAFRAPLVTEISPAAVFYPAEKYHQNYYGSNGKASYCQMVIKPKMDKFKAAFADKLK